MDSWANGHFAILWGVWCELSKTLVIVTLTTTIKKVNGIFFTFLGYNFDNI